MLLENGAIPRTHSVRGTNYCLINVFPDRIPGRAIIISVVSFSSFFNNTTFFLGKILFTFGFSLCQLLLQIDNLVKGASGQALQNLNVMLGFPGNLGLHYQPLFP